MQALVCRSCSTHSRDAARLAAVVIGVGLGSAALAQPSGSGNWPDRPIRLVVPFAAGGALDVVGRILGQKLTESLGRAILIDNRLGAAGNIGAEYVAKAMPDGYTLLMSSVTTQAISMTLIAKPPYDFVRDYAPVALVGSAPLALIVHSSLPVKSVREFIALAKARPGELNYFSSGTGSGTHMGGALFDQMAGIRTTHVPYKGGAAGINDLLSGQIHFSFSTIGLAVPYVEAGRIKLLAVGSTRRYSRLPNVPTIAESGVKGYEAEQWYGVVAPAGTPVQIVNRLAGELKTIVAAADVRDRFFAQGVEPVYAGPDEFAAYIKTSVTKFGKIVRDIGLKPE
ncbi:MAG: tripartite tricarboxylate transporter substrate binding protein [Proteobacteria bacterium]|nr:tripartite tricarboxylate transporter substrate binding protein [Burkholderiales bacterium]